MFVKKYTLLLALLLSGAFSISTRAQLSSVRLDSILNDYSAAYPQERMHFHFDKAAYAPGDTVWFRGYLFSGIELSLLSKTVYVDFSEPTGKVLAHLAYTSVFNFGQFKVPDSLMSSSIHVRAYTKWMLNFDTAFLYNKDIKIVLPTDRLVHSKAKAPVIKQSLNFFPEGGWLVNGLLGKVAFKANDQYGRPVKVKGVISDSKGAVVAKFESVHDGLGFFPFTPVSGEKYTAKWSGDGSPEKTTALPDVQENGLNLTIGNGSVSKSYTVTRTATAPNTLKDVTVVASIYQQVVYVAKIKLQDKTSTTGRIPVDNLPAGVLQITVLDGDLQPVAERITYVNNVSASLFEPQVGFTKLSFAKKSENDVVVQIPDSLTANMSLAITEESMGTDSSDNIISRLLLSGDLRGDVYHAPYYFSDTTDEVKNNLDLVLMTHGWRRFDISNVAKGKRPAIQYPADTTLLSLSGKIFGASPDQLRAIGNIIMIVRPKDTTGIGGRNKQMMMVPVRQDGSFIDSSAVFFDSLSVYYQFSGKKNLIDRVSIKFMPNRLLPPKTIYNNLGQYDYNFISDTTGDGRRRYFADVIEKEIARIKGAQLADVVVKGRVKTRLEEMNDKYASAMFKSSDGYSFDIVNDPVAQASMNIFQYLQSRVAGLQITNPMGNPPTLSWRGSTPALFLDEVPLMDATTLSNMSMSDVAMVKVFRPPFIGAMGGGAGGAIAVYTRRGDDVQRGVAGGGLPSDIIAGYSEQRQFFVPDYSKIDEMMDKVDNRTTLYWNPFISLTPDSKTFRFKFYNNDYSKAFRIVLEGVDSYGRLTHIEKVLQ